MALLRPLIAMALTSVTSITLVYRGSLASLAASSPTLVPLSIKVNVIFPIYNITYNITELLLIVFALQNLITATAFKPFSFF
jgi:hypothetical protein